MEQDSPQTIGTVELAETVGKPRQTVNRWITTGKLNAHLNKERVGSPLYEIRILEAVEFLEERSRGLRSEAESLETAATLLRQKVIAKEPDTMC